MFLILPPLGRDLTRRGRGVTTVSFYVCIAKPTSLSVDSRCVAAVVGFARMYCSYVSCGLPNKRNHGQGQGSCIAYDGGVVGGPSSR